MTKNDALRLARANLAEIMKSAGLIRLKRCESAIAAIDAALSEPEVPEGMVLVPMHAPLYSTRQAAKRYRYLRVDGAKSARPCVWMCNEVAEAVHALFGAELDKAIDAELATSTSPQEQA